MLASASPARARLLRGAGVSFDVMVSGVDESRLHAPDTVTTVARLAAAKADAVAALAVNHDALVLGCDSLLDLDGRAYGKPADDEAALALWSSLRGRDGTLCTGHHLIDVARGQAASAVGTTTVHFGHPDDGELAAYVASGEATTVAGGFTLDGRAAPFVDGVDGDPNNVIGLSLALLRRLLQRLGVTIVELWAPA